MAQIEGEYQVNVGISASDNATADSTNMPDDGEDKAMLAAMDLDDHEPSYGNYNFFQTNTITGDNVITVKCTPNNYPGAAQGSYPPPPDTSGGSAEHFNRYFEEVD